MSILLLPLQWVALLVVAFSRYAASEALDCQGDLYFHVQNVARTRETRDYFFHTSADNIQDCARKCYGNLFCFSVGFSPRTNQRAACLFSYKSGYGCTKRNLVKDVPAGSDELVVECMRCPSAGDLTSPPPNSSGIDGFGLGVGQNVSNQETGVAGGTVVDGTEPAAVVKGGETVQTGAGSGGTVVDGTEPAAVVKGGETVQTGAGSGGVGCLSPVTFQAVTLSSLDESAATQYPFDKQVNADTAAQCASLCFAESGCRFAGFIPQISTGEGNRGICYLSASSADTSELDGCGGGESGAAVTSFQATEDILIKCINCPGGQTGAVIDPSVVVKPAPANLLWFCLADTCSSCEQGRCPTDIQLSDDETSCNAQCPRAPECYFCRDGTCLGAFGLGCGTEDSYGTEVECSAACGDQAEPACWLYDTIAADCVGNAGVLCLPPPGSAIQVFLSREECMAAIAPQENCYTIERSTLSCVEQPQSECGAMTALRRFKFSTRSECEKELKIFATGSRKFLFKSNQIYRPSKSV